MNLIDSNEDLRFSIHPEYVRIYPKHTSSEDVKIYQYGRIFINNQQIKLNTYEEGLSVEYFITCDIMEKEIEILVDKTADIGVLRMLSPFYDADDLEEDIEIKSSDIEAKADELELSNKLEKIHKRLKMQVDALYNLS